MQGRQGYLAHRLRRPAHVHLAARIPKNITNSIDLSPSILN